MARGSASSRSGRHAPRRSRQKQSMYELETRGGGLENRVESELNLCSHRRRGRDRSQIVGSILCLPAKSGATGPSGGLALPDQRLLESLGPLPDPIAHDCRAVRPRRSRGSKRNCLPWRSAQPRKPKEDAHAASAFMVDEAFRSPPAQCPALTRGRRDGGQSGPELATPRSRDVRSRERQPPLVATVRPHRFLVAKALPSKWAGKLTSRSLAREVNPSSPP